MGEALGDRTRTQHLRNDGRIQLGDRDGEPGEAGPGQWITVYANAGHAWVIIAGLAFDTSGGAGPRWHTEPVSSTEGFIARHPPGY